MKTVTGITDKYIQTIIAGAARWSHRKCRWRSGPGGHFRRICRGARKKAMAELRRLGFSGEVAERMVTEAREMAELEMNAEA